jgi:hypothetical protein
MKQRPAGRSTPQFSQEVAAFFALSYLLPFVILKEKVRFLAVFISGHHGPVAFTFGDGTDVDSDLACLQIGGKSKRRGKRGKKCIVIRS